MERIFVRISNFNSFCDIEIILKCKGFNTQKNPVSQQYMFKWLAMFTNIDVWMKHMGDKNQTVSKESNVDV